MKLGDFTGIRGIPNQDIAMWETMGPIADRTRERLGASDFAVVEFRRHDGRGGARMRPPASRRSARPNARCRSPASARSRAWCRSRPTGARSAAAPVRSRRRSRRGPLSLSTLILRSPSAARASRRRGWPRCCSNSACGPSFETRTSCAPQDEGGDVARVRASIPRISKTRSFRPPRTRKAPPDCPPGCACACPRPAPSAPAGRPFAVVGHARLLHHVRPVGAPDQALRRRRDQLARRVVDVGVGQCRSRW